MKAIFPLAQLSCPSSILSQYSLLFSPHHAVLPNFDPWVEDLFTDAFNAVGPVLMMSVHVLVINCPMHNPDAFAERTVRAATSEKFKADPTFKNMMKYLIDNILMRRRTVKRTTNDWDTAAYLEDEEDDNHQARPSRSRRSLAHADPTTQGSSAGPSTSRRRVGSPSTDRGRNNKRATATTSMKNKVIKESIVS